MNLNNRIDLISEIGKFLTNYLDENYDNSKDSNQTAFEKTIKQGKMNNPWFTDQNIKTNLTYWAKILNKKYLT